jgi:DNA-binding response OmpR family regulator
VGAGREGNPAVSCTDLAGQTILVVEEEPLIALDLQMELKQAGANVVVARNSHEALARIRQINFAAGVIDWRPESDEHRAIARALRRRGARFVFYATCQPEDVTTVRGAPIILKPERPDKIIATLALLVGAK